MELGKRTFYFCGAEPPLNPATSTKLVQHKYLANRFLEQAGIPVPKAVILMRDEFHDGSYIKEINPLQWPLVAKPLQDQRGNGVLCNIKSISELQDYLTTAFERYELIIIEEFHAQLNSYRVLVFNQKIIGIVLRYPAHVLGNGKDNIPQLIQKTNQERLLINEFLGPILLDAEAKICLREQGLTPEYIPQVGEKIALGYTSNATRGGTYENYHGKVCHYNRQLMKKVANVLDLKLVGIDVQCADLNIPINDSHGVIIEANEVPSIRIHELPMYGKPVFVTRKIMRYFIYQHPLAYLLSLYSNKRTAFYMRSASLILLTIISLALIKGMI